MIPDRDETTEVPTPPAAPTPPTSGIEILLACSDAKEGEDEDVRPRAVFVRDVATSSILFEICFAGSEDTARLLATALSKVKHPRVRLAGGWLAH